MTSRRSVSWLLGLAFGFAVMIVVYVFGHVSGAHINPTVTISLAAVGRFPWRSVPGYLVAQLAGAILASLTHWLMFGSAATSSELLLGTTVVGARGPGVALFTEVVLGFLLVVVVMATVLDERAVPAGAGLAIGVIIGAGVVVTFNVSGGSFNAARTLGPVIVSGQFPDVWVYLLGPAVGGVLGAAAFETWCAQGHHRREGLGCPGGSARIHRWTPMDGVTVVVRKPGRWSRTVKTSVVRR